MRIKAAYLLPPDLPPPPPPPLDLPPPENPPPEGVDLTVVEGLEVVVGVDGREVVVDGRVVVEGFDVVVVVGLVVVVVGLVVVVVLGRVVVVVVGFVVVVELGRDVVVVAGLFGVTAGREVEGDVVVGLDVEGVATGREVEGAEGAVGRVVCGVPAEGAVVVLPLLPPLLKEGVPLYPGVEGEVTAPPCGWLLAGLLPGTVFAIPCWLPWLPL